MRKEELLKIAKPVLFNTEMVRAILNGTKYCTRRIIKPQPTYSEKDGFSWKGRAYGTDLPPTIQGASYNFCSAAQYKVGDVLYVRESWCELSSGYEYKADGETIDHLGNVMKWHPSLHMPKEAARIFLKVTGVRVERLQDITEEQAVKEGCKAGSFEFHGAVWGQEDYDEWTAIDAFKDVWNSTIDRKELDQYGWDANPWVWVYEFEVVKPQIFSEGQLKLAKQLAYKNWENQEETEIGFEFKGAWVTNPFVEVSGRFEFKNFDGMCQYYGTKNVVSLLKKLLKRNRENE